MHCLALLLIFAPLTLSNTLDLTKEQKLQKLLEKTVDGKKVFGASFAILKDGKLWQGAAGDLSIDKPFFMASTTKLFTTALIMRFVSEGKLQLNDRIARYLSQDILLGLHVYKGKEYSREITVQHLLAHTSGLPDYFQDKGEGGRSWEDELVAGNDRAWTFEECIQRSKKIKPHFAPGAKGKAHYSDANFQLLGKIIESIAKKSYASLCNEFIIQPLGLNQTWLYTDNNDARPKHLYYEQRVLNIPKAMTSFGPDGGMVSTAADMVKFVEAFFSGKLFPKEYLNNLQVWNRIFFPMKSGVGIHLFKLPWLLNPTGAVPAFIGHSGLSGALAYYCPEQNTYYAGTVNQVAHPDLSFKTMIKLSQVMK